MAALKVRESAPSLAAPEWRPLEGSAEGSRETDAAFEQALAEAVDAVSARDGRLTDVAIELARQARNGTPEADVLARKLTRFAVEMLQDDDLLYFGFYDQPFPVTQILDTRWPRHSTAWSLRRSYGAICLLSRGAAPALVP